MTTLSKFQKAAFSLIAAPLTAAALVGAPTTADAFGLINCTGVEVRIKIFNADDAAKVVAQANQKIASGATAYWHKLSNRNKYVDVYTTSAFDNKVVSRTNLKRNWDYRITNAVGGDWDIVPAGNPASCG